MQINPTFAFASGATQGDISEFESAVDAVINVFDSTFSSNVTLNVDFAYGESFRSTSDNNSTINYVAMPNANPNGMFTLGTNTAFLDPTSYSTLLDSLQAKNNGLQQAAYSTLPPTSPFGGDTLVLSTAQRKALGLAPSGSFAGDDGVIGIISNEELQAGGLGADWTQASPGSSQFYMIGIIEHELSEVMGRFSYDGLDVSGYGPAYSLMDLFRYSGAGVRQTSGGNPSYFSTDNGNSVFYYWNNPLLSEGDLGDWAPSGPNGADSTGNDAFLNASGPGVVNSISPFDLDLMNAVGWNLSSSPSSLPSPAPPPASTSAILVQGPRGNLQYLEFSGSTLAERHAVSYGGSPIVAEGDFNHDGRSELVAQNPATGAIDLLSVSGGVLQSSLLEQGSYWHVVGAGDFDGSGRTAIATQNQATGQIDLLWFNGTQLASSVLLSGTYQHVAAAVDFNGDGTTDLITQNPNGGPLDFLSFSHDGVSGSVVTPQSFAPIHDALSTGPNGQSVLVSQHRSSGEINYLDFDQTQFTGSSGISAEFPKLTPVQGSAVASQFFGTSF
jgi:hypothetical protein